MSDPAFLDGVPGDKILARLRAAPGNEFASGKLGSIESSAALAVNTFGWFIDRPHLIPQLPSCPTWDALESVEVEYCARFPWAGGRHPWLDAIIRSESMLIGIESKRFEPFRDAKRAIFSQAYDHPSWGEMMKPYERIRDTLRANPRLFKFLDAAQLVKHAFGLVTEGRRLKRRPHLHYLFAEPTHRAGRVIDPESFDAHRREIDYFQRAVRQAEVGFSACSYREWLATWRTGRVSSHAHALVEAFNP